MAEKDYKALQLYGCTQSTTISSKTTSSWSNIQPELLELILKKLGFVDIIRFRSVSSSWESTAKSYISSPFYATFPQIPWLMAPSNQGYDRNICCFFNLADQRIFKIKNNRLEGSDDIVGSSHGWLIICNYKAAARIQLFNPFCDSTIQLPLIPTPVPVFPKKVVISSDPSRHKNNNFILVAIYEGFRRGLAFYMSEDIRWRTLLGEDVEYRDIIFYNGDLFAVTSHYSIEVWEFKGDTSYPKNTMAFPIRPFSYLVDSLGDLLLVHQDFQDFEDFKTCQDFLVRGKPYVGHSTCNYFNVYKLDFAAKKWERVESLHGRALFLAHHRSAMSLSTSDFPELEENSIYFTNEFSEMNRFYILLGVVYNMETKVFKSYYKFRGNCGKKFSPLFWIVPDPW